MKNPLVSVIIPCYNYAAYVEEAIQSAINQTYKNIELIVINDGSTDNSDEIITKLQKKYNFIYHKQKNQGIVATRNKGISLAKGEYLVQLDADDWLDKTYIEETLRLAQKKSLDIVYTQAKVFGRVNFITNAPEFNIEYLKHEGYIHASALLKKKALTGHKYDVYLSDKGNEDWDLFLDMCLDGAKAGLVNKPLLNYRKHEGVISRADKFENTKKEILVRHHVLSKQNAKHPDKMWYFSPYINMLKSYIDNFEIAQKERQRAEVCEREARAMRAQLETYSKMPSVRIARWIKSKIAK